MEAHDPKSGRGRKVVPLLTFHLSKASEIQAAIEQSFNLGQKVHLMVMIEQPDGTVEVHTTNPRILKVWQDTQQPN